MADRIQLSEAEATAAISNLRKKGENVQQTVNNLQTDVNRVQTWWKGDSALAFVEEFTTIRNEINKRVGECIDFYCNLLDATIKAHQAADASIANQIRGR